MEGEEEPGPGFGETLWSDDDDGDGETDDLLATEDDAVGSGHAPPPTSATAATAATDLVAPQPTAAAASSVGMRLSVGLKAGMEAVDRAHVDAVIARESEGSAFWKNEERKEERTESRIQQMLRRRDELRASGAVDAAGVRREVDGKVAALEAARNLSRCIVHIDMDSFYAAVEERDNPALKGHPMAVGGIGMLSTSNYAARRFGVRAAMPGYIAKKLCPELLIVKPRYNAYREASDKVHAVLAKWDPGVQRVGMDEAYLDMTRHAFAPTDDAAAADPRRGQWGDPACMGRVEAAVAAMRAEISAATGGLTASAGLAPNRMLAKIASDVRKPNGQYVVPPTRDAVLAFVRPLAVRKVGGIGKVTASILDRLGVTTCADLFEVRQLLSLLFSRKSFAFFLRSSLGVASVTSAAAAFGESAGAGRKSISTERTFREICDPDRLRDKCRELCTALGVQLVAKGLQGRTVGLKLKTTSFTVLSRAVTLPTYVSSASDLESAAVALLDKELAAAGGLRLRLMGVRLSALRSPPVDGAAGPAIGLRRYLQPAKPPGAAPAAEACEPVGRVAVEGVVESGRAAVRAGQAPKAPASDEVGGEEMRCPVCDAVLPRGCDANRHVDSCLSKRTIREILGNEANARPSEAEPAAKKRRNRGPLDAFVQRAR